MNCGKIVSLILTERARLRYATCRSRVSHQVHTSEINCRQLPIQNTGNYYDMRYSLFGRVVELVLVGAAEAFLDSCVRPQPLHCCQELVRERLRVLHALNHIEHHLRVTLQQQNNNRVSVKLETHRQPPTRPAKIAGRRVICGYFCGAETSRKSPFACRFLLSVEQISKTHWTDVIFI